MLLSVFLTTFAPKKTKTKKMKVREFFGKFASAYLLGHLLAMVVVLFLLGLGVKYGLEWYTRHDQAIPVPKLEGMLYAKARDIVIEKELNIIVSDSGYNKQLPANCVLVQNPAPGMLVKAGHTIYVTLNSPSSPSFPIPDIVDNSSYREAEAKLMALGFKLLPPQRTAGEKDWVYGILCRGRKVSAGEHISIEHPLTLIIGSGNYGEGEDDDDADYIEPEYQMMMGEADDFEEVSE